MRKVLVNLSEQAIFEILKTAIIANNEGKFPDEILEEITKAFEARKVWHNYPEEKPSRTEDYFCVFKDGLVEILEWNSRMKAFVDQEYLKFFEDPVKWIEIPENLNE